MKNKIIELGSNVSKSSMYHDFFRYCVFSHCGGSVMSIYSVIAYEITQHIEFMEFV
jgi:hypothetical protein